MTRLFRAFGAPLASVILLLSGVWILGLIAAPQLIMIEQSLWRMERPEGSAEISVQIDGLYNRLDVIGLDRSAAESETDSAKRETELAALAAEEAAIKAEIAVLEEKESAPVKVYTLDNFGQMGSAHLAIFAKTIVVSLAVSAI